MTNQSNTYSKEMLYRKLFDLEKDKNIDIKDYLKKLAQGKLMEVSNFVDNQIASEPIPDFINSLTQKKFYKTIIDSRSSTNDKAKALSSLVTHVLIEYSHGKSNLPLLSESVKLKEVLTSLSQYCLENNSQAIEDISVKLRNLFITVMKSGDTDVL